MGKSKADEFVSRWGDAELDDKQYASVPGWIMRNYHKFKDADGNTVGLTPDEFQVMVHIMSFKYDVAEAEARPSLQTVAEQVGKHISSVRRTVKRIEQKGALTVDRTKRGRPNTYDFGELAQQCRAFDAARNVEARVNATPSVDATPTPSVDASTPLAYTLPEDQNKLEDKNASADAPAQPSAPMGNEHNDVLEPNKSKNHTSTQSDEPKPRTEFQQVQDVLVELWFDGNTAQYGRAGKLAHMLMGTSKVKGFREYNLKRPITARELRQFAIDYRKSTSAGIDLPASPETLNRHVYSWQKKRMAEIKQAMTVTGPTAQQLAEAALYGGAS